MGAEIVAHSPGSLSPLPSWGFLLEQRAEWILSYNILSMGMNSKISEPQRHQAFKNVRQDYKCPSMTLKCFRYSLDSYSGYADRYVSASLTISSKEDFCRKMMKNRKFFTDHIDYPKHIQHTHMVLVLFYRCAYQVLRAGPPFKI